MKIINKKDKQIEFSVEIDETLMNAIRRYVNQIPILAIDEVEISKNDSPLYDETIAHRMGLIPLKMDKSINEKTSLKLIANKKDAGEVYSEELTGKIKPVYGKIPITSLNKGQELEIVANTKLGVGAEHSKFSPGMIFYRNIVDINIDKICPQNIANICPRDILKLENGKVIAKDNIKCDLCEVCVDACKKQGKDSIKLVPTKELVVNLESFGQLNIEEIFKKSIEILKKDINEFSKKIEKN